MAIIFLADKNAMGHHQELLTALSEFEVSDVSAYADDYVALTHLACSRMNPETDIAVLICGTGQGTTMVANKHKGIRATRCLSVADAQNAKIINNANALCLSAENDPFLNKEIIMAFLTTTYEGRKPERFEAIRALEDEQFK